MHWITVAVLCLFAAAAAHNKPLRFTSLQDLVEQGLYQAPDPSLPPLDAPGFFLQPTIFTLSKPSTETVPAVYKIISVEPHALETPEGQALLATLNLELAETPSGSSIFVPIHSDGKERYVFRPNEGMSWHAWLNQIGKSEVGFTSQVRETVNVYWIDERAGQEMLSIEEITFQQTFWINSYIGHQFVARDASSGVELGRYSVEGNAVVFLIEGDDPNLICNIDVCEPTNWNGVKTTPLKTIWLEGNETERSRVASNRRHPSMLPHFTEVGFRKSKIPTATWGILSTFWRHNRQRMSVERWTPGSTFVNHKAHATFMTWLPEHGALKQKIFDDMKPHLEEWSGIAPLIPTSFYGIRTYTRGSVLENHVDRASTHVVSVIFNIDQEVEEDWPLEIYDHDGEAHHVLLQPGEMVFYESATCIHGRPTPLTGRYFANAFIHYKPANRELWPYDRDTL